MNTDQFKLVASSSNQKKTKRKRGLKKCAPNLLTPGEKELKNIEKKIVKQSLPSVQVKKKKSKLKYKIEYKPFTIYKETKGEEGNFIKLIYNQPKY